MRSSQVGIIDGSIKSEGDDLFININFGDAYHRCIELLVRGVRAWSVEIL
jgi:hypothetical protein